MKLSFALALLLLATTPIRAADLTFEKDVRPIMKTHCTHCHGEEEKLPSGVDLRMRRFMDVTLEGGAHVLTPGNPDTSEMVRLIRKGEMPKKGKKLAPQELATLERWIKEGAKTARPEPATLARGPWITEDDRQFWSLKPIVKSPVPAVPDKTRIRTPIDAFVLAKLRGKGLNFAPDADKRTLLRRVTLDLTGVPPTTGEMDDFLADATPGAYEKVVERLLASSAYGERWARHWLDVAGYADSNGFAEADSVRPYAWRYRDYVIRSIAADKPWNEFIVEQLAGDELAGATHTTTQEAIVDPIRRDDLVATAFLRMAPDGTGDPVDDLKLARNQVIAEEIKVVSSSLLGLTVGCAQCHDHRYDPITQADYYRLRAIFEPAYDWQSWRPPSQRLYSLYTPKEQAAAGEIEKRARLIDAEATAMSKKFLDQIFEKEIVKLPEAEREPYRTARATAAAARTPEQQALIKKYPSALALYSLDLYDAGLQKQVMAKSAEAAALRATKPVEGRIMALTEVKGQVPATKLFHRGDHDQPKQTITPGELSVLATPRIEPFKPAAVAGGSTGRRLAYAQWLTSGQHPLVARVLVNRFWLNHFGRGLVNTPGDFGMLGERPTHPELLDWLASEFMAGGWKLKPLHRLMVLSTTYRQSSRSDASLKADPDDQLYARFKLQRLDAEALRDSMLAACGTLNRTAFGSPANIARDSAGRIVAGIDKGTITTSKVESAGGEDFRRSIYMQVRRTLPLTVLDTFDAPTMVPNCEERNCTTVAPQSLMLMNDTFIIDVSRLLADRLRREAPDNARAQIKRAWAILYGRDPKEEDITRSLAYLSEQTVAVSEYHHGIQPVKGAPKPDPELEALSSLCQIMYSSNRFLYVE